MRQMKNSRCLRQLTQVCLCCSEMFFSKSAPNFQQRNLTNSSTAESVSLSSTSYIPQNQVTNLKKTHKFNPNHLRGWVKPPEGRSESTPECRSSQRSEETSAAYSTGVKTPYNSISKANKLWLLHENRALLRGTEQSWV